MRGIKSPFLYKLTLCICCITIIAIIYFIATGQRPCPMCILQQSMLLLITLFSLVASIHNPKTLAIRVYSLIIEILALIAAIIAFKQLWMQAHPEAYAGSCQAGVDSLFNNIHSLAFLKALFTQGPDCSAVDWSLFGVSMAGYSLLLFALIMLLHFYQFLFYNQIKNSALNTKG